MTTATIAHSIVLQAGIYVWPDQVTECSDGYAVSNLPRDAALHVARTILGGFADDPDAGLPMVRICTGWRGTPDHTVRLTIS